MIDVTTYSVIYFNIIFLFGAIICTILVFLFSILAEEAVFIENCGKLIAGILLSYIIIPVISLFWFDIYLGGLPAKFGGIPDYHKISPSDVYSMSYNGNEVPESQYLPTLKLVSDKYRQEYIETLKRRVTKLENNQ